MNINCIKCWFRFSLRSIWRRSPANSLVTCATRTFSKHGPQTALWLQCKNITHAIFVWKYWCGFFIFFYCASIKNKTHCWNLQNLMWTIEKSSGTTYQIEFLLLVAGFAPTFDVVFNLLPLVNSCWIRPRAKRNKLPCFAMLSPICRLYTSKQPVVRKSWPKTLIFATP